MNENLENKKIPKIIGMKALELVQILHQSEDIDACTKNKITSLTRYGMQTGDFTQLNSYLKSIQYGTTMSDIMLELINLTL